MTALVVWIRCHCSSIIKPTRFDNRDMGLLGERQDSEDCRVPQMGELNK